MSVILVPHISVLFEISCSKVYTVVARTISISITHKLTAKVLPHHFEPFQFAFSFPSDNLLSARRIMNPSAPATDFSTVF